MEIKNLKCSYKKDKDCEPVEEIETSGCVNHIVIKPEVEMTFEIEGLVTGMAVVETDDKVVDKKVDDHVVYDGINCIVVKPKIKIDCNLSGLTTQVNL